MALEQSLNLFALLGGDDGEDIAKLIKRVPPVVEKKKRQPQAPVKKEQTQLSPEMLKAKPIVLPDHIRRRDLVLRKPKAIGEGRANNGYGWSYGMGNGYGCHGNYGVSTGSQGNSKGKKGNKRNGGDSTSKLVDEDGWQVCTRRGSRRDGTVGTQQVEEQEQYGVNKSGKLEAQQIAEKKKEERLSRKRKSKKDKHKKKDENEETVGNPLSTNVFSKPVKESSEGDRLHGFFKSKLGKGIIWVSAFAVLLSILLDV